jgi:hypothetical protein
MFAWQAVMKVAPVKVLQVVGKWARHLISHKPYCTEQYEMKDDDL